MSYELPVGEPAADAVRAVAIGQLDEAAAGIADPAADPHALVHDLRKRCKKLRSLVRLVHPHLPDHAAENAFFREFAAELAGARDQRAMLEAVDALTAHAAANPAERGALMRLQAGLESGLAALEHGGVLRSGLGRSGARLRDAADRVGRWRIAADGFAAFAGGLARAYRRGRKALRRADATAAPERFHELRKRVKDHLYHLRLLAPICPPLLGARRELADRLADLLGDEHDLTVLAEYAATVDDTLTAVDRVVLAALLERRRGELRAALRPLAEWLFAEPTDRLVERFASYWQTGLSQGPCGSRRTSGSAAPDGSPDRPG